LGKIGATYDYKAYSWMGDVLPLPTGEELRKLKGGLL